MTIPSLITWLLLAAPALAADPSISTDQSLFTNEGQYKYRLPSVLVTSQGTLLVACQKRGGRGDDFAPSSLVLRRSLDGGKTFEPEQTLFEHSGDCTFNGNLVEERQSRTIFACFIAFPQAQRATWFSKTWMTRGGGFSIVKSTDEGKTWSAPIEVIPAPNADGWHGGGAFNNNHGVQLQHGSHAGRLVIAARVFKTGVYEGRAKAGLIYSDDRGESWRVGGVVLRDQRDAAGEVTLAETADGEVYVNCRNAVKKVLGKGDPTSKPTPTAVPLVLHQRIWSRSRDGGETFYEEGFHAELYDEPCNAGLVLYAAKEDASHGCLIFTAPAGPRRTRLTGYVSRDGGRTWKPGRVISESAGGYSDTAILEDGGIVTLYEGRQGLLLARYNLGWLTSERDARDPGSN
jgi:sialidase-1